MKTTFSLRAFPLAAILLVISITGPEHLYGQTNASPHTTEPPLTFHVDPLSVCSLLLVIAGQSNVLGSATGFIIKWRDKNYLITNWHVVTGKDPRTNTPILPGGQSPTQLIVCFHGPRLGTWFQYPEPLFDQTGKRLWIEHPNSNNTDVVALPIMPPPHSSIYPLDLALADVDMLPDVAMPVSIIGFPQGLTGPGKLPIWKTGHIATDPDLDFDDKPVFLIDATTRAGMSGSPVVLRLNSGYRTTKGSMVISSGFLTRFLGVYSAQFTDTEIGYIWRPRVISEILSNGLATATSNP